VKSRALPPILAALGRDTTLAAVTDAELLGRHKESEAFAEIVRRYGRLVWRACRNAAGSGSEAEDAFQITFLALARHANSIRKPAALAGWLYQVATRAGRKVRQAKPTTSPLDHDPATAADPLDRLTAREFLAAVDRELAALPDRHRLPLLLCGVEGLTVADAARRLGWTPDSVKGRLERGRRVLRTRLAARGLAAAVVLVEAGAEPVRAALVQHTLQLVADRAVSPRVARLVAEVAHMGSMSLVKSAVMIAVAAVVGLAWFPGGPPVPLAGPELTAAPAVKDANPLVVWNVPFEPDVAKPGFRAAAGAWAPDGKHFLAAGSETVKAGEPTVGEVRAWDAETGKMVRQFRGPDAEARKAKVYGGRAVALAVSPDGTRVAAADAGSNWKDGPGYLDTWDFDGPHRARLVGRGNQIVSVAFGPDGNSLAAAENGGTVFLCELARGRLLWAAAPAAPTVGVALAFLPDAKVLVGATAFGGLIQYDVATGVTRGQMAATDIRYQAVAVSPDGSRLVAGGRPVDAKGPVLGATGLGVRPADRPFEDEVRPFDGLPGGATVNDLAFAPDGKHVAAACSDGFVRVFDAKEGKVTAAYKADAKRVHAVRYAPDGKRLLVVGEHAASVLAVAELMKRKPE
jgi:RNA polymerase sigma factor (sigma-70 family)